jgi:putative membrane protein
VPEEPKHGPRVFELGSMVIETTADPYEAEAKDLAATHDADEEAVEVAQKQGVVARSLLSWGGLFWSATGGLVSLGFGLWLARLIDDLFVWQPFFGVVALALAVAAGTALFVLATREVAGIFRQRHIAELRSGLVRAREKDDFKEAQRLVGQLSALYSARPETARARAQLRDLAHDIVDGRDRIDIAERMLIEPLDLEVQREILKAAKRVAMVTALVPRASIDVVFVAAQAIRLIRRIAVIYGGRPGLLGFLKLLRSIAAHLAITGGMAAVVTLATQVVGGIAAIFTARAGEGGMNGLLTARVGISAMKVCRPMRFGIRKAPNLTDFARLLAKAENKG